MRFFTTVYDIIIGLCLVGILFSCDSSTKNQTKEYKTEKYIINPDLRTGAIKKDKYTVDSICSLNIPDDIVEIGIDKMSFVNNDIYILDLDITEKIYKFDNKGDLKVVIGERGNAKGEFVGQPNDYFIDSSNRVHVFDKIGHKIIVYNEDGSVCDVINTEEYFPHSFGLTSNDKYMMFFLVGHINTKDIKKPSSSLILLEPDCKNYKQLMSAEYDLTCVISRHSFFQDSERLTFVPNFSDSVIVFKNDTIEKVVQFDFGKKVLCKDIPDVLKQNKDVSFMSNYQGVLGIRRYQETESLVYLEYIYKNEGLFWLYNKRSGQIINDQAPFEGIDPYSYYIINGNQIIGYVKKEMIESMREFYRNEKFQENLKKSPQYLKDMLEGKIKTPALVYMTLK